MGATAGFSMLSRGNLRRPNGASAGAGPAVKLEFHFPLPLIHAPKACQAGSIRPTSSFGNQGKVFIGLGIRCLLYCPELPNDGFVHTSQGRMGG